MWIRILSLAKINLIFTYLRTKIRQKSVLFCAYHTQEHDEHNREQDDIDLVLLFMFVNLTSSAISALSLLAYEGRLYQY